MSAHIKKRKSKFTRQEWYYTGATEDLFTLDKNALSWYKLIVKGAP